MLSIHEMKVLVDAGLIDSHRTLTYSQKTLESDVLYIDDQRCDRDVGNHRQTPTTPYQYTIIIQSTTSERTLLYLLSNIDYII